MQDIARLSHTTKAEAKRRNTSISNLRHVAATEKQRSRLRPQSINVGRKLRYSEIENPQPPAPLETRPTKRARVSSIPNLRTTSLLARISQPRPSRFDVAGWRIFKRESILQLQPFYPNSTISHPPHFRSYLLFS